MKPSKKKPATKRSSARRPTVRAQISTKRRSVRTGTSAPAKKKVAPRELRRRQPSAPHAQAEAMHSGWPGFAEEILKELRTLRAAVIPKARASRTADDELESTTTAIRRLLTDYLERDQESLLRELVLARHALTDSQSQGTADAVVHLDRLIKRLGALEFSAQELDFVDPLIHAVKAERCLEGLPDGVVAESLRPGIRSRNGVVIAKAWVAVNRR